MVLSCQAFFACLALSIGSRWPRCGQHSSRTQPSRGRQQQRIGENQRRSLQSRMQLSAEVGQFAARAEIDERNPKAFKLPKALPASITRRTPRIGFVRFFVERWTTAGRFASELTGQQQQRLGTLVVPPRNPSESTPWATSCAIAFWGAARRAIKLPSCISLDPIATEQQQKAAHRHGKESGTIASQSNDRKSDFLTDRMAVSSTTGRCRSVLP